MEVSSTSVSGEASTFSGTASLVGVGVSVVLARVLEVKRVVVRRSLPFSAPPVLIELLSVLLVVAASALESGGVSSVTAGSGIPGFSSTIDPAGGPAGNCENLTGGGVVVVAGGTWIAGTTVVGAGATAGGAVDVTAGGGGGGGGGGVAIGAVTTVESSSLRSPSSSESGPWSSEIPSSSVSVSIAACRAYTTASLSPFLRLVTLLRSPGIFNYKSPTPSS